MGTPDKYLTHHHIWRPKLGEMKVSGAHSDFFSLCPSCQPFLIPWHDSQIRATSFLFPLFNSVYISSLILLLQCPCCIPHPIPFFLNLVFTLNTGSSLLGWFLSPLPIHLDCSNEIVFLSSSNPPNSFHFSTSPPRLTAETTPLWIVGMPPNWFWKYSTAFVINIQMQLYHILAS